MNPLLTLITKAPKIDYHYSWVGWLGFLVLISLIIFLLWRWNGLNRSWEFRHSIQFVVLLFLVPVTSLFLGFGFSNSTSSLTPGNHIDSLGPVVMIFSAIPFTLAAGLLGPLPAAILALFSGLFSVFWETHDIFTALELALIAVLLSAALRQRYRTTTFRLLRHPLISTFILALIYPIIYIAFPSVYVNNELVNILYNAINNVKDISIAFGIEILFAGLVSEIIYQFMPSTWQEYTPLVPSPAEKSLQTRFVVSMVPLAMVLILTLMVGDWIIAGAAAKNNLKARMENAASLAAENVPYFMETGQNLISSIATDSRLMESNPKDLEKALADLIKSVAYFNKLAIVDSTGSVIAYYPPDFMGFQTYAAERSMIDHVLNGVPFSSITVPPKEGQTTAQISFISTINNKGNQTKAVLIGRSDLASNPFTQPLLSSLNNLSGAAGQGILLDEDGQILVHPDPEMLMTKYSGYIPDAPEFYEETAPDGTRLLVRFEPAQGRPWAVILMVPAYLAQQLALSIATPLLVMLILLSIIAVIVLRLGLDTITGSLQNLATQAGRLAQGNLDQPLTVEGEDELAQLRDSFEQMRVSLKARLDELNRLLLVSQGVASSLEISEAVQPILESSLAFGASTARVVLTPDVVPELGVESTTPVCFGMSLSSNSYNEFDEQILAFTRQQDRLVLSNLARPRLFSFTPGSPRPESLIAVALRHESLYYGAFWVAYDKPHDFSEEEVRFIVTLGSQAAVAAANARLFQTAEIGRQRLAAILASTPDPVLVTDQRDRLLLTNPAAWQVLGLGAESDIGKPVDQVINQTELVELLRSSAIEGRSLETPMEDGRVYLAEATPVIAEGQRVGRVCVMRDITHFKELDALKSEFVSTVSHDLRSPLTLMRGYTTMLEMVGSLNELQTNYVHKILSGVESMSHLVNNLLDLGRIETGIGLQVEKVSTQEVVERVVSSLQLQATHNHIQLTIEIPQPSAPVIEADPALLQQALHNLVENAIKFTRSEGKVHVRVESYPNSVIFEVIDNGIGISPMDQPRLFEKFFRGAQQMTKDERGTGLGLAIVKSIAEKHGGRVWAESLLGKGSKFSLSIPLKQPQGEIINT